MRPISKTVNRIVRSFPGITFAKGDEFYWSSTSKTVFYQHITDEAGIWLLLHEIAHANLGHSSYKFDVELVKHESAAWRHAVNNLASRFETNIDSDFIEDALDTYRLWLHRRSTCPACSQTGIQQNENTYSCLNCRCSWRVNDARLCTLRRKTLGYDLAASAN